jgi:sugar (glycoside-pentoside-hexuronide) transporter
MTAAPAGPDAAASERIPAYVKAGFALGDHTINIQLATVSLFFLFFLTEIAGLPPSWAGLVLLAGRGVDAVTDPLMGRLSDQTRWSSGRRRPYFLLGAVPFGLTFALLWADSGFTQAHAIVLYYGAVYVLNTLCSTVLAVPYMALLPEIALDYHERTSMNSYRMVGVVLAIALAAIGMPLLVKAFGGEAGGWAGAGRVLAVWVAIPWLVVFAVSWERPGLRVRADAPNLRTAMRRLVAHRSYRILTGLFLSARIAVDVAGALLIFFFTWWLGRPDDFPIALGLMLAGVVVSLPLWLGLARRMDKRVVFMAGALLWSLTLFGLLVVGPETPRWVAFALMGLAGAGYGVADLVPWAMLGDVIDEDELRGGERRDGIYAGSFTFLRKLGGASGVALAGFALEGAGFVRGAEDQPESALLAIRLLVTLGPVFFLLLACWIAARYPLTRQRHSEITTRLAASRAASASGAARP